MREVLFKAKLQDWKTNPQHNKWVEGYYLSREETTYCFTEDYEKFPVKTLHYIAVDSMTDWGLPNEFRCYEIDPDTLCQYTNKNDIDGNKVWENDIVKYWNYHDGDNYAQIKFGTYQSCFDKRESKHHGFYVDWKDNMRKDLGYWFEWSDNTNIVGNIFDNPEILKGEEVDETLRS